MPLPERRQDYVETHSAVRMHGVLLTMHNRRHRRSWLRSKILERGRSSTVVGCAELNPPHLHFLTANANGRTFQRNTGANSLPGRLSVTTSTAHCNVQYKTYDHRSASGASYL